MRRYLRKIAFWGCAFFAFIFIVGVTTYAVLKTAVYPARYKSEISELSAEYDFDIYLIYALINAESGFDVNAVSNKNAKGLMQITDQTAAFIADKLQVQEYDLFDPATNLRFGCFYLRYLTDKFKEEKTALAAYNAGERNVSDWLKDPRYSADGKTLYTIPFKETDDYLKRIENNKKAYRFFYRDTLCANVDNTKG